MFNLSVNCNQISRGSRTVPNSKNYRNNQSPAENDITYPSLHEGSPTFHRCQISCRLTPKFKLKTHIGKVCNFGHLLRATRGARNPNPQVDITHASFVCSQHSIGLLLRMYGIYRTQFDHARLDFYHS